LLIFYFKKEKNRKKNFENFEENATSSKEKKGS